MSEEMSSDENGDKGDTELSEQLLIGTQPEVALLDHLDIVVRKAEQEMSEKNEEREQRRHRERSKEERRGGHGEHDHHAAHRRRAALLLMARGSRLADALPVFQAVQERQKIHTAEEHNGECRHDGQQEPQLWAQGFEEGFHQCAPSPVNAAIICSMRIPREPLKRTVSPSMRWLRR